MGQVGFSSRNKILIWETKLTIGVGEVNVVASSGDAQGRNSRRTLGAEFQDRSQITRGLSLYESDRILGDGNDK